VTHFKEYSDILNEYGIPTKLVRLIKMLDNLFSHYFIATCFDLARGQLQALHLHIY
jgi:hypothetical protein